MKRFIIVAILLGFTDLCAQPAISGGEHLDPGVGSKGRAPLRNEFMSFDSRKAAESGRRDATQYYVPLPVTAVQRGGERVLAAVVDIPFMWVDRDLFLHVEGLPAFYVVVGGRAVGYSQDSRCPSEFLISPYVTDGHNRIEIRVPDDGVGRRLEDALESGRAAEIFLYSQPKVRIEDYTVSALPDSTGAHTVLDVAVAVSNSYDAAQRFMVGFDIYSPGGELQTYDIREVQVGGGGRDTVRFRELIYHGAGNRWTPESPKLYSAMTFVRREGFIVEYVPFKVGFGSVGYADGALTRNGRPQSDGAAPYAGAADPAAAEADLRAFRARGVNTVWLKFPQPYWFYDLCDRVGMNVVDQADLNFVCDPGNQNLDGTLSNNPAWEASFLERINSMYARSRAHACVIGYSLGGDVGNGYNMYEGYNSLKATGTGRAVMLPGAGGYWNNDAQVRLR